MTYEGYPMGMQRYYHDQRVKEIQIDLCLATMRLFGYPRVVAKQRPPGTLVKNTFSALTKGQRTHEKQPLEDPQVIRRENPTKSAKTRL